MWPISKLKAVFASVDEQLKAQRDQIESLQRQISELNSMLAEEKGQRIAETELRNAEAEKYSKVMDAFTEINLKDRLHEHQIGLHKALSAVEELQRFNEKNSHEIWMTKFGYDNLISNLQLSVVETQVKGNRDRLRALKDTHLGERCFIIGNGPSLEAEDLTVLHNQGVFCFGAKRINKIFDQTPWRPNIWAASDLDFISLYADEISQLEGFEKLVPCQSIINLNQPIKDAIYFPFIQAERSPCWFNADIERGVHFWGTITCKMINFAVYMGFEEIYLLGVDNTVPLKEDPTGKVVYDTAGAAHFSSDYYNSEQDFEEALKNVDDIQHIMHYVDSAYKDIKWFCDQRGVKIYNATRGGRLETYPRRSFNQLFQNGS